MENQDHLLFSTPQGLDALAMYSPGEHHELEIAQNPNYKSQARLRVEEDAELYSAMNEKNEDNEEKLSAGPSRINDDCITVISTNSSFLPNPNGEAKRQYRSYSPARRREAQVSTIDYKLQFIIEFTAEYGETLGVIGNIQEFGNWKNTRPLVLKKAGPGIWKSDPMLIKSAQFFQYKYVVLDEGIIKRREKGANRIADLAVLEDQGQAVPLSKRQSSLSPSRKATKSQGQRIVKTVEIQDEWEHFKIKFSINDPIEEELFNQGDYMRIIGSTPKLGQQEESEIATTPPIRMQRAPQPIDWLIDKYGVPVRPWEILINFQIDEIDLPHAIKYNFSKSNEQGTRIVNERYPSRQMVIQSPDTYQGELGKQKSVQWKNQQNVWIVNGMIDKADANFLGGLYFDEIGDTNISVGTYPLRESDVSKMSNAAITGVLNLQTDAEIQQRGIALKSLKQYYQNHNIRYYRFPLSDLNEDELCASLFLGAQHLNNMINTEGLKVYVHCTSGISRAPALIVTYLCLFKKVKQWETPKKVAQYLRTYHFNSKPNLRAIERVIQANLEFQRQQLDHDHLAGKSTTPDTTKEQDAAIGFYFPQFTPSDSPNEQARKQQPPSRRRASNNHQTSAYKKVPVSPQSLRRSATPSSDISSPTRGKSTTGSTQNYEIKSTFDEKIKSQVYPSDAHSEAKDQEYKTKSTVVGQSPPLQVAEKVFEVPEQQKGGQQEEGPRPATPPKPEELSARDFNLDTGKSFTSVEQATEEPPSSQQPEELEPAQYTVDPAAQEQQEPLPDPDQRDAQNPVAAPSTDLPAESEEAKHLGGEDHAKFVQQELDCLRIMQESSSSSKQELETQALDDVTPSQPPSECDMKEKLEKLGVRALRSDILRQKREQAKQSRIERDKMQSKALQTELRYHQQLEEKEEAQERARKHQRDIEEFEKQQQEIVEKQRREKDAQEAERLAEEARLLELKEAIKAQNIVMHEEIQIIESKIQVTNIRHSYSPRQRKARRNLHASNQQQAATQAEHDNQIGQERQHTEQAAVMPAQKQQLAAESAEHMLRKQKAEQARIEDEKAKLRNLQLLQEQYRKEKEIRDQLVREEEQKQIAERILLNQLTNSLVDSFLRREIVDFYTLVKTKTDEAERRILQRQKEEHKEAQRIATAKQIEEEKEQARLQELAAREEERLRKLAEEEVKRQEIERAEKEKAKEEAARFEAVRIAEEEERTRQEEEERRQQEERERIETEMRLASQRLEDEKREREEREALEQAQRQKELVEMAEQEIQALRLSKLSVDRQRKQDLVSQQQKQKEEREQKLKAAEAELQKMIEKRLQEEIKIKILKQNVLDHSNGSWTSPVRAKASQDQEMRSRISEPKLHLPENTSSYKMPSQIIQSSPGVEHEKAKEATALPVSEPLLQVHDTRQGLHEANTDQEIEAQSELPIHNEEETLNDNEEDQQIESYTQEEHDVPVTTRTNPIPLGEGPRVEPQLNELMIERHCLAIFKEAPIKFDARRGNLLEEALAKLIKKHKITVPVVHVDQSVYLVGPQQFHLQYKLKNVMIKAGTGVDRFEAYVVKHQHKFCRSLVELMSKSQEPLAVVVEMLVEGKKIRKRPTASAKGDRGGNQKPSHHYEKSHNNFIKTVNMDLTQETEAEARSRLLSRQPSPESPSLSKRQAASPTDATKYSRAHARNTKQEALSPSLRLRYSQDSPTGARPWPKQSFLRAPLPASMPAYTSVSASTAVPYHGQRISPKRASAQLRGTHLVEYGAPASTLNARAAAKGAAGEAKGQIPLFSRSQMTLSPSPRRELGYNAEQREFSPNRTAGGSPKRTPPGIYGHTFSSRQKQLASELPATRTQLYPQQPGSGGAIEARDGSPASAKRRPTEASGSEPPAFCRPVPGSPARNTLAPSKPGWSYSSYQ